jgi:hypothetical protein
MWWMKMVGRSGICIIATAASIVLAAQGCAQLPFGSHAEADKVDQSAAAATSSGTADVSSTRVSGGTTAVAPGSTVGSLSQTMTMPGGAAELSADSRKVPSPMKLSEPTVSGMGGAVIPVAAIAPATTIPLGAAGVVNAEMNKFIFHSSAERARYEKAAARFPQFCHDWQRMLHDRETNNLQHLTWQTRDGAKTSSYTGYGQVDKCEMKESVEGVPIGKISYMETIYFLAGKNADEARHAAPRIIHQTHTLEIFSWEKDKWFY